MTDTRRLLDLPFVFTQTRLLTPREFGREARQREVFGVSDLALEALHETRMLVPLYRVTYDVRAAIRAARRDPEWRREILAGVQQTAEELMALRAVGRVLDPAGKPFVPWRRYERHWEGIRFRSSDFLIALSAHRVAAPPNHLSAIEARAAARSRTMGLGGQPTRAR